MSQAMRYWDLRVLITGGKAHADPLELSCKPLYARQGPGLNGLGFPEGMATPIVDLDRAEAEPWPIRGYGSSFWLVSERMRAALLELDPDAFQFIAALARYPRQEPRAGLYWFCSMLRVLDAIDEAASDMLIQIEPAFTYEREPPLPPGSTANTPDGMFKNYALPKRFVFRPEVVNGYRFFRPLYCYTKVFVSDEVRARFKEMGARNVFYRRPDDLGGPSEQDF